MNTTTSLLVAERSSIEAHYNGMISQLIHLHESIWEEIKHFTWFLTILVGAPFAFLLRENGANLFYSYGWIFFFIAAVISFGAVKCIKSEGKQFLAYSYYVHRAEWALGLYSLNSILSKVGTPDPHIVAEQRRNYFDDKEDVSAYVTKRSKFRWSSIRWIFILLFIIYGIISSGLFLTIVFHLFF